jgi:hypothetical protein
VTSLVEAIADEFAEPGYRADLASITGARDDAELAAWIGALCRAQLGASVAGARFASKSMGAVFGVELADGTCAVLKLFPPVFDEPALRAIERCQTTLYDAGFPVPRQLAPMFSTDVGWGAFYELVDGDVEDAHRPDIRTTLAQLLARLAGVALDPTDLPPSPVPRDVLWHPPHRTTIDLARPGGEWIDERAEAARQTMRTISLPAIAAHSDWGTKNTLFAGGHVVAVLDWDSLVQMSEAEMVGRAAAQFAAQWNLPSRLTPTPDEASAFVADYEDARRRRFDRDEQRVANASADYIVAHVARQTFSDPASPDDDFRRLLRDTANAPLIAFRG